MYSIASIASIAPTATTPIEKKRAIILLQGATFSARFIKCWTEAIHALLLRSEYDIRIVMESESSQAPTDYDFLIIIDSRIIFTSAQLQMLFETMTKSVSAVVCGYYVTGDGVHADVLNTSANPAKLTDIEYFYAHSYGLHYMTVSHAGLGFAALRKKAVDAIAHVGLRNEYAVSTEIAKAGLSIAVNAALRVGIEITDVR